MGWNLPMGRPMSRDYRGLTDAKIARWFTKPGRYCVGGGLYLDVTAGLTRSWFFRYLGTDGKRHDFGLGSTELVTLDEARAAALECRKLRARGGDPLARRRRDQAAARLELAKRKTFAECFEAYFAAFSPAWSAGHAKRVRANITTYALPILGKLPVSAIDTQLILQVLAIWNDKTELARKLRGVIEAILDFATGRGMRDETPNPARWKGHLDTLLARPSNVVEVEHHKALHWREMPEFFAAVRADDDITARAVELMTLTVCRKGRETLLAQWGEFDLEQRIWTLPIERMKPPRGRRPRRPQRIPLSTAAMDLLERMRAAVGGHPLPHTYLFTRKGKLLNVGAPDKLYTRLGWKQKLTTHGLRSSHTDFAAENLIYPREVREMALGHKIGDDVELAYLRTDLFAQRRGMAEAWGCWCEGRLINPAALIDGRQPEVTAAA